MISDWYRHLPPDKQDDFKSLVNNSTVLLNRLREIITEYEKECLRIERFTDYDAASWSHKQAHLNGRLQELQRIKILLTIEDKHKDDRSI